MDVAELLAAVLKAEHELQLAKAELAEAEIEPSSEFSALDELRNRAAAAAVALTRAQRRWLERVKRSPGGET